MFNRTRLSSTGLLFLLLSQSALAAHLNDTGMVRCAAQDGALTTECIGTGQDGQFGRDVNDPASGNGHLGFAFIKVCNSGQAAGEGSCPPNPSFGSKPTDWGCTYDAVTQLLWENKTHDGGVRDKSNQYDYQGALDMVSALNQQALCGQSNWRLPKSIELQSIVWYGRQLSTAPGPFPALDQKFFPNTGGSDRDWTTSFYRQIVSSNHYQISFSDGSSNPNNESITAGARAVSAPLIDYGSRLRASNSTVVDKANRLEWQRCSAGQRWNGVECSGTSQLFTWQAALEYASSEARLTGENWRLPNIKELASIVDSSRVPTIDASLFPNTDRLSGYWASTPFAERTSGASSAAWSVSFEFGTIGPVISMQDLADVRLVRDTH